MGEQKIRRQIRNWIVFFICSILVSGLTAFPIESELAWLTSHTANAPEPLSKWLNDVYQAVRDSNLRYPFLSYGTDWLAFAHIVIALMFIGPLRDPVKNIWVIEWAMLSCLLVFPLALIAGPIRHIPFFHQLIDCSFGVFGLIPLIIVRGKIKGLEAMINERLQAVAISKRGSSKE